MNVRGEQESERLIRRTKVVGTIALLIVTAFVVTPAPTRGQPPGFSFPYSYGTPVVRAGVGAQGVQGPNVPLAQIGTTGTYGFTGSIGPTNTTVRPQYTITNAAISMTVKNGTTGSSVVAQKQLVQFTNISLGTVYQGTTSTSGTLTLTIPAGWYDVLITASNAASFESFSAEIQFKAAGSPTYYLTPATGAVVSVANGGATHGTIWTGYTEPFWTGAVNMPQLPIQLLNASNGNAVIATAFALSNGSVEFTNVNTAYSYGIMDNGFRSTQSGYTYSIANRSEGGISLTSNQNLNTFYNNALAGLTTTSATVTGSALTAGYQFGWSINGNTVVSGGVTVLSEPWTYFGAYTVIFQNGAVFFNYSMSNNGVTNTATVAFRNETIYILCGNLDQFGHPSSLGVVTASNSIYFGENAFTPPAVDFKAFTASALAYVAGNTPVVTGNFTQSEIIGDYLSLGPYAGMTAAQFNINVASTTIINTTLTQASSEGSSAIRFSQTWFKNITTSMVFGIVAVNQSRDDATPFGTYGGFTGSKQTYMTNDNISFGLHAGVTALQDAKADGGFYGTQLSTVPFTVGSAANGHDNVTATVFYEDPLSLNSSVNTVGFASFYNVIFYDNNVPLASYVFYGNNGNVWHVGFGEMWFSPVNGWWNVSYSTWYWGFLMHFSLISANTSFSHDVESQYVTGDGYTITSLTQICLTTCSSISPVIHNLFANDTFTPVVYNQTIYNVGQSRFSPIGMWWITTGNSQSGHFTMSKSTFFNYVTIDHCTFQGRMPGGGAAGLSAEYAAVADHVMSNITNDLFQNLPYTPSPGGSFYDPIATSDVLVTAGKTVVSGNVFLNLNNQTIPVISDQTVQSLGYNPVVTMSGNSFFYAPGPLNNATDHNVDTAGFPLSNPIPNAPLDANANSSSWPLYSKFTFEYPLSFNGTLTVGAGNQLISNSSLKQALPASLTGTTIQRPWAWDIAPDVNTSSGSPVLSYANGLVAGPQPNFFWHGYNYTEEAEPLQYQIGVNSTAAPTVTVAFGSLSYQNPYALYEYNGTSGARINGPQNVYLFPSLSGWINVTYTPATMPASTIFQLIPATSGAALGGAGSFFFLSLTSWVLIAGLLLVLIAIGAVSSRRRDDI